MPAPLTQQSGSNVGAYSEAGEGGDELSLTLDTSDRLPRLFFTEAGMAELRAMVIDRRFADPPLCQ
jgi:hypothetical protein